MHQPKIAQAHAVLMISKAENVQFAVHLCSFQRTRVKIWYNTWAHAMFGLHWWHWRHSDTSAKHAVQSICYICISVAVKQKLVSELTHTAQLTMPGKTRNFGSVPGGGTISTCWDSTILKQYSIYLEVRVVSAFESYFLHVYLHGLHLVKINRIT